LRKSVSPSLLKDNLQETQFLVRFSQHFEDFIQLLCGFVAGRRMGRETGCVLNEAGGRDGKAER
jgi:hypothetical protein